MKVIKPNFEDPINNPVTTVTELDTNVCIELHGGHKFYILNGFGEGQVKFLFYTDKEFSDGIQIAPESSNKFSVIFTKYPELETIEDSYA